MPFTPTMRALTGAVLLVVLSTTVAPVAAALQQPAKMIRLYLVLLVAGPSVLQTEADAARIQAAHLAHLEGLVAEKKALAVGPMGDKGRVMGISVLRASSADEARLWAEADPAVKAGRLAVEVLGWWVEDGYLTPTWSTTEFEQLYFGFLVKGPKWTPERTPETAKIQEGHMAHLSASHAAGVLRLAGPTENADPVRGIVIYRTSTLAQAAEWAEADPAVRAGRLAVELHPWFVPRGTIK